MFRWPKVLALRHDAYEWQAARLRRVRNQEGSKLPGPSVWSRPIGVTNCTLALPLGYGPRACVALDTILKPRNHLFETVL